MKININLFLLVLFSLNFILVVLENNISAIFGWTCAILMIIRIIIIKKELNKLKELEDGKE